MLEVFRNRKLDRATRENTGLAVFWITKNRYIKELFPFFLDSMKANFAPYSTKQRNPAVLFTHINPAFGTLAQRCEDGQSASWIYRDIFRVMGKPAVPSLIKHLHSNDYCISEYSAWALAHIGKPAIGDVIRAFDSNKCWVRQNALTSLLAVEVQVIPYLIRSLTHSLKSKSPRIRLGSVKVLGRLGQKLDTPTTLAITKLINDEDKDVRFEAIYALISAGGPARRTALPELQRLAKSDPYKCIRDMAKWAIKEISK